MFKGDILAVTICQLSLSCCQTSKVQSGKNSMEMIFDDQFECKWYASLCIVGSVTVPYANSLAYCFCVCLSYVRVDTHTHTSCDCINSGGHCMIRFVMKLVGGQQLTLHAT